MACRHMAGLVFANDRQFVHVVSLHTHKAFYLVLGNPRRRLPDVLMHRGTHGPDHPAVAIAVPHFRAHGVRLRAVPQVIPVLHVQVTHHLLVLRPIAGHDIAIGIDKEGVECHIAGQKARLSVNVVDEPVVEIGAEPLLRAIALKKFVHQLFKVLGHHGPVVDYVLCLNEVEAVMQARCGKLHSQFVG